MYLQKNWFVLSIVLLLVATVGNVANAAGNFDDGDPNDHLWSSADNWDNNVVPAGDGTTVTVGGSYTCDVAAAQTCRYLNITGTNPVLSINAGGTVTPRYETRAGWFAGETGTININGGTLDSSTGYLRVGATENTNGTVNITNNGAHIGGQHLFVGDGVNSTGEYNMSSGTSTLYRFNCGGADGANGTVSVSGGTLTSASASYLGNVAGSTGTLDISGDGTVNTLQLHCGEVAGATSFINMDGGTLDAGTRIYLGDAADSNDVISTFIMNDGTVDVDTFYCGHYGDGIFTMAAGTLTATENIIVGSKSTSDSAFTMNGGTVNITGTFVCGQEAGSVGMGHLLGGTINASTLSIFEGNVFDIEAGTLILDGDDTASINWLVSIGRLTGYGGTGTVMFDYNVTNPGKTTVWAVAVTVTVGDFDDGEPADHLWGSALNWKSDVVPAGDGTTVTLGLSYTCDVAAAQTCRYLNITGIDPVLSINAGGTVTPRYETRAGWVAGETGTINITGGTLDSDSHVHAGRTGGSTGTMNVTNGGTLTTGADGNVAVGQDSGSEGYLNIDGSTLNLGRYLVCGAAGSGTMVMDSGTVTVAQQLQISQNGGTGIFTMNGGDITVTRELDMGIAATGSGTLNMTGGSIDCSHVKCGDQSDGTIDMTGGTIDCGSAYVGLSGDGTFTLSGSGTVNTYNHVYVGTNSGSEGTLNVNSGGTWNASENSSVMVAYAAGSVGNLNIDGGTLNLDRYLNCCAAGSGTVVMDSGTVTVAQQLQISQNGGTGTFTMNGGSITVTEALAMGIAETGAGTLYMNDGTIDCGDIQCGYHTNGTIDMTGGTINCGNLYIGVQSDGIGQINLDGGTINAVSFTIHNQEGAVGNLDIAGAGQLIIDGDWLDTVLGYIDSGEVTGDGNPRAVSVVYDRALDETIVSYDADAVNYAYNPNPVSGAGDVPIDAPLSWSPGDTALSHDVYFGAKSAGDIDGDGYVDLFDFSVLSEQWLTNRYYMQPSANLNGDDIVDMGDFAMLAHDWMDDALVFIGNQEPCNYDPALEFGQSYLWRIDEVDAANTWEGRLWSFETQPWPVQSSPGYAFALADKIVYTNVFIWYTSDSGQLNSPWLPLEGRENWTGEPDWWKGQIKQMMASNLDIIFVELYGDEKGHSQQRINLFGALGELRALGYDVPKVAPFLDIAIQWSGDPDVDLATEAGKDEFVSHYINFFNDYYSVNTDADADSYIAQIDGGVVLVTYGGASVTNDTSLSREDVESRLDAEFCAEHSIFCNTGDSVYKISNWINDSFYSWADEKAVMFGVNAYYATTSLNGIQSAYTKPGYWDEFPRPDNHTFLARNGGTGYTGAWNSVNANSANDRVFIESFNEYDEGSGIYACDVDNSPVIPPDSSHTDTWSSTGDPFEYIKTTYAGASIFNNRPDYDSDILWHNIPASMSPDEVCSVMVVVRNDGDLMWTGADDFCFDQLDADVSDFTSGRCVVDDSKNEISIYGGIFRGRVLAFEFDITAPSTAAIYDTNWSMVEDDGTPSWFGETLNWEITVE